MIISILVLSSNVPSRQGSSMRNQPCHYHIHFPRPFDIEPTEWKVAIAEISFPQSGSGSEKIRDGWYKFISTFKEAELKRFEKLVREGYLPSSGWLEKLQRSGRVYIPTFVACKARGIQNDPWALGADDSDIEGKDYSRTEYTNLTTLLEFLNKARLEEMGGKFKITSNGYVTIGLRKRETVLLDIYLAEVLGFEHTGYCGNGTPCTPTAVDDMLDDQYYDIRAENKLHLRIAG